MTDQSAPHQDDDKWAVDYLRATTFIRTRSMEEVTGNTWWEKVIGGKPDDERILHQKGVKEQKGMLDGSLLTMLSQISRVDWTLTTAKQVPSELLKRSAIGSMSDTLKPFLKVVENWLGECPPTNRLAFGAALVRPVADVHTGHKEILQFLPDVRLNHMGIDDFLYQINRHRKSTSGAGIRINRLSKWSVVRAVTVGIPVDPMGGAMPASEQESYACALELDVNTAPSRDEISRDITWPIFQELTEYGREIAIKGDIP